MAHPISLETTRADPHLTHSFRFPNESAAYRSARDDLLRDEVELRRHMERVAGLRRALPLGGEVEDYEFNQGSDEPVRLSGLFDAKPTLVTYSWMYGPQRENPCPSCSALLDGLNGASRHVNQRISFVALAGSPIERIRATVEERGWTWLKFASTQGTSFNRDYGAEDDEGGEWPVLNVFTREGDIMRHRYATEMMFTEPDTGQDMRHNGPLDVVWNLYDFTPEGRGKDWSPKLEY